MKNELYIIKSILIYNIYIKYNNILDKLFNTFNSNLIKVYNCIKEYYKTNEKDLSVDDLKVLIEISYPFLHHKEATLIQATLEKLHQVEINPDLFEEYLASVQQLVAANELAIVAVDFGLGKSTHEDVAQAFSYFDSIHTHKEELDDSSMPVPTDLSGLLSDCFTSGGIKWRHSALNRSLGPLRKGDFGFIFGRPETGKTTFLADFSAFACSQEIDGKAILWFNNEEQGKKVMLRIIQAVFGVSIGELKSNADYYGHLFSSEYAERIRVFDNARITGTFVESIVKKHPPALIIVDQIDKVKGFDADRKDLELGAIYRWFRELAKEYAPVIGVSQADVSGEGKKLLTMDNVADAKTSKQAEADWILGIGATHEMGAENTRYFNISKNKLLGSEETLPELRHGSFSLKILPEIGRYSEF